MRIFQDFRDIVGSFYRRILVLHLVLQLRVECGHREAASLLRRQHEPSHLPHGGRGTVDVRLIVRLRVGIAAVLMTERVGGGGGWRFESVGNSVVAIGTSSFGKLVEGIAA